MLPVVWCTGGAGIYRTRYRRGARPCHRGALIGAEVVDEVGSLSTAGVAAIAVEKGFTVACRFPDERAETFFIGNGVREIVEVTFARRIFGHYDVMFGIALGQILEISFPIAFLALCVAGKSDGIELDAARQQAVHPLAHAQIVAA